jgi:hypothetical protein
MNEFKSLSDMDLLQVAKTEGLHNPDVNEEWLTRHGINFPYQLDEKHRIINRLTLQVVRDESCDKMIRRQANKVREGKR